MDEQFGKYRLIQLIATGGMAEVFLAVERTPHSERHVVIKRILPSYVDDPDFTEFFLHEARLALQLNHPNVVQTYELGEENGSYYLAMEYVRGETVLSLIRRATERGVQLSLDGVAKIAADVIAALDHVHSACDVNGTALEIVHRDVSPHNIVVSHGGVAKLVDFGIARAACQEFRTQAGVVKGKFAYLAPEQLHPDRRFDHRADLFALGIVLFEMLTRRPLFRGANDTETMKLVVRGRIPPLRELRTETPAALAAVVEKALERDPDRRYANAAAMLADLDEATRLSGLFPSVTRLRDEVESLFEEEEPPTVAHLRTLAPSPPAVPAPAPAPAPAQMVQPVAAPRARPPVPIPRPARPPSATPRPDVELHAAASPPPSVIPIASRTQSRAAAPFPAPLPPSTARGMSDGWVPERDIMLEHFLRLAGSRRPSDRSSTLPLRSLGPEPASGARSVLAAADDIEAALRKALTPAAGVPSAQSLALALPLPLPAPDNTPATTRLPAVLVPERAEIGDPAGADPEIEPDVLALDDADLEPSQINESYVITDTSAAESVPELRPGRRWLLFAAALTFTAVAAAVSASFLNLW